MLTDSYGRDLNYLRRRAPTKPARWQFIVNAVWPLQYIELWNARQTLELATNTQPQT